MTTGTALRRAEIIAAVLLTVEAIWLRVTAATCAGALWRDEANTVGVATLPTVRDVWHNLQFDSFPIVWLLVIREFTALAGPLNDSALRVLGLSIGLGIVAALWFYARSFGSLPSLSLALLALAPSIIIWGDSARADGLGIMLIILFGALIWRFANRPSTGSFALATIAAIASVQTLYYNSVVVFAFCVGAVVVCASRRDWRTAALVVTIGLLAALTMILYIPTIREASDWNVLVQIRDYTFQLFWSKLYETLKLGGRWALGVWAEAFILALGAAGIAILFPRKFGLTSRHREVALFSCVSMVVGGVGIFIFLRTLSYLTQPWYYLTLLTLSAVCIDSIAGAVTHSELARKGRVAAVLLIGVVTIVPASRATAMRMTNVDLVALRVSELSRSGDLVIVNEWFHGVTFFRYYDGVARATTLPPIGFYKYHRYDLIKNKMMDADQTEPVRELERDIIQTLSAGHRVFIVGALPVAATGDGPILPPRAPDNRTAWSQAGYAFYWSERIGEVLQHHSANITVISHRSGAKVSDYENLPLFAASGWHP